MRPQAELISQEPSGPGGIQSSRLLRLFASRAATAFRPRSERCSGVTVSPFVCAGTSELVSISRNVLETDCAFGRNGQVTCKTYDGPSLAPVLAQIGYAVLHYIDLLPMRNVANAFLYDRRGTPLWKFIGIKPWEVALAQGMNCVKGLAPHRRMAV